MTCPITERIAVPVTELQLSELREVIDKAKRATRSVTVERASLSALLLSFERVAGRLRDLGVYVE